MIVDGKHPPRIVLVLVSVSVSAPMSVSELRCILVRVIGLFSAQELSNAEKRQTIVPVAAKPNRIVILRISDVCTRIAGDLPLVLVLEDVL